MTTGVTQQRSASHQGIPHLYQLLGRRGRGLLATREITQALMRAGVPVRAGVQTGEVERRGDDLGGLDAHIAARVMATAGAGEIMVSRTIKNLLGGSPFRFEDRGTHGLKGVAEDWQLFALVG